MNVLEQLGQGSRELLEGVLWDGQTSFRYSVDHIGGLIIPTQGVLT